MEELETSKENYQPLKKGRVLNAAETEKCAEASHLRLRGQLLTSSPPAGPLSMSRRLGMPTTRSRPGSGEQHLAKGRPFPSQCELTSRMSLCRYIKWTQLNVKSGSSNADLIELFERCTQDIQKHRNYERYKNDPRFLRIWVQYVRALADAMLANSSAS